MTTSTTITVRVRYHECDPMRVAHHSVYAVWLEMARVALLAERGIRYRDLESEGVCFVVARLTQRFRKPACYDDELEVDVEAVRAGGSKIDHTYRIRRGRELLATAETTIVCVDDTGRPRRVPEALC